MRPSRNTQWNRIRLTQTAQEAGVLTSDGSGSRQGCCGKSLLWGGNSFNKLGLCPENTNAPLTRPSETGFALLSSPLELYPARLFPPPTPQTSFDKYSWITLDGPKGQGPETLSAFYLKALESTLCLWRRRQAFYHTKAALFLHMWRLLIRINDFFLLSLPISLFAQLHFAKTL